MNRKVTLAVCLALQLASVSIANASPVTSLSGTVVPMATLNYFGPGPVTQAPGITWNSENVSGQGSSVFGYTNGYGFAGNGYWEGDPPMIGTNDPTMTMEYSFSTPINGVGGFLNYATGYGTPTISVFDSTHSLIESLSLSFLVSGNNGGEFHGFQEASDSISYFALSGAYIGLRDLTISGDPNGGGGVSAVPLPAALPLMASALGLFGLAGARRRKNNIS